MSQRVRVVITGGAGLLATNMAAYKKESWDITLLVRSNDVSMKDVHSEKVVLECRDSIQDYLEEKKPDLVIHAAGVTNVDFCESNTHAARVSNVVLSKNIAAVSKKLELNFVHISTDHFSRGDQENSSEEDIGFPVNEYARSKLEAEIDVLRENKNSLIVRTNFFGWGTSRKESFSDFIINKLRSGEKVFLFEDIFFTPIFTETLVDRIELLLNKKAQGIFNVCGEERISKYDFGLKLAKVFGLDSNLIVKSSIDDVDLVADRPKDMSLSTLKSKNLVGENPNDIEKDLELLKECETNGRAKLVKEALVKNNSNYLFYGRQWIDDNDIDNVVSTMCSGWLTQGPRIPEFERRIAKYTNSKYAVSVNNLTSGLHIGCLALGVGEGDYVITSPISFVASSNAALFCGAKPLFADIDKQTANICPKRVEELCIRHPGKIKVVIPVHFAGHPCDMKKLNELSSKYGFEIFEDAAHALGGEYETGEKIGSCVDSKITGFSFHPVKSMTTGEGGVLTTNDENIYHQLLRLRSHGINKSGDLLINKEEAFDGEDLNPWYYEMQQLGYNYRITDIQCSLGISQLSKIDRFMKRRREIAAIYDDKFSGMKNLTLLQNETRGISGNHLYVVKVDFSSLGMSRNRLYKKLEQKGIKAHVHYIPIPLQPYYREHLNEKIENYPGALDYYRGAVTLPLYPGMQEEEIDSVVNAIRELVG
jgi:UDP-4-amino-4,6-dideoxy-N-acetyl-beta-L-altrosamine transaminase/dTDP-4-dehydrorhamnose reductase